MEKYYLKNGQEVKMGDTLVLVSYIDGERNEELILLTKDCVPTLLEMGFLLNSCSEVRTRRAIKATVPLDINYYIEKIANKMGWQPQKVENYLNNIDSIYPAAAFSMVLREIAIELDKKYEDHIEKSPEIYVINMYNGKITKANKAVIKSYKHFAAFRTIEDARVACHIMRDVLKDMFKGGK